jgi:hypothetical protein
MLVISGTDPGAGAFLAPGSESGSGSGMKNPDHISESFETIFWVKILKLFDPGWEKFGSGIWDKHPGSATLLVMMTTQKTQTIGIMGSYCV